MSFVLDAVNSTARPYTDEGLTLGEIFTQGGQWFLLGMVAVFAVLALIWGAIELFHRVCSPKPIKNNEEVSAITAAPAPVLESAPVAVATATDDGEIIAVIMAAIQAAESETPGGKFRVVSFRKK